MMEFADSERESLLRLLTWRRDVRHFETREVPPVVVQQLRLAMDLAPSVGNSRPWRIFQVESQARRLAVHDIFRQANAAAMQDQVPEKRQQYQQLKLEGIETAPLQLAVFTDTDPTAGYGLGRHSMAGTLEQSTAMAVQNLNLVARAQGLGVGMVSVLNAAGMERLFEVPQTWRFSLYLCIGWPQFTDDLPLLHRNGWQENQTVAWESC
ncbi:cob(II)yrinic acid a,c-diamide reductase [Corticibacter populi]|nr:cob(II)yrinic acid a,c-diamide reductase [Corticibacter populi]